MGVVEAKIQTVEEMYRLIWTAIAKQATDQRHLQGAPPPVLSSPVGPQSPGPAALALLPIWRGERERSGADRLTGKLALRRFREAKAGGTVERFLEDRAEPFPSRHVRR